MGELRERPRGRERPVRAELHLRRRARLLRPRDLLPLHGPHARGAGRDDRDVHAEAVLAPDGERLPLPHVALGRRHEPLPRRVATRAGSASPRPPTASSAASQRTRARTAAHRADRELVQAPEAGHDGERRDLVAGLDLVRLQQPHADAPHPGAGPHRGPHDRRLVQPVPRRGGGARRRARRDRVRSSTPASRTPRTSTRSRTQELRARGLESLPANLLEAIGELEGDDVLRAALGRGRDEDYVDYFARVKRDEWFRYHEQVTPWEIREYLTRF